MTLTARLLWGENFENILLQVMILIIKVGIKKLLSSYRNNDLCVRVGNPELIMGYTGSFKMFCIRSYKKANKFEPLAIIR